MNTVQTQKARATQILPISDEELEAQAIRELERLERAKNRKRSGYAPKRRRKYENTDR